MKVGGRYKCEGIKAQTDERKGTLRWGERRCCLNKIYGRRKGSSWVTSSKGGDEVGRV